MPGSGERFARANGVTLCYEEFGDPSAPTLLLIAGLSAQMLVFQDGLCDALAAEGLRVIRFDNRDVGRSTQFDAACPDPVAEVRRAARGEPFAAPYGLEDMADDAAGLLDALGIGRAAVCGASMGGAIAQLLAVRHPARVCSLVCMMTPAVPMPLPDDLTYLLGPPVQEREAWIEADVDGWRAMCGGGFAFDEEGTREMSTRAYDRGFDERGPARQLLAIVATGDRRSLLSRLAAPALVVHGDADPLVPLEAGREVASLIPGARLEVIPGLGHELPRAAWRLLTHHITQHALAHA
jgi:pimeloyl-ACP methyl ester carboxylesterase